MTSPAPLRLACIVVILCRIAEAGRVGIDIYAGLTGSGYENLRLDSTPLAAAGTPLNLRTKTGAAQGLRKLLRDTDRCGPSYGNRVCGLGKCCGRDGRCGTTNETCWTGCQPLFGRCEPGRPIEEAPLYTFPQPIVLGTATAEVEQYSQTGYTTGSLFCKDVFEGHSHEWLAAFPWAGYCAPYMGGMRPDLCGECLRVTNTETNQQAVVRIVDMCATKGLTLDWDSAFLPLDGTGHAARHGHMQLVVEQLAYCPSPHDTLPPLAPVPPKPRLPTGPSAIPLAAGFGAGSKGLDGSGASLLGFTQATYHRFQLGGYRANSVFCASSFEDKPQVWLDQYPKAAYCMPHLGPMRQELCGQCLRLTNRRTSKQLVVRIVDECSGLHGGLDLDWEHAFRPLDTDHSGFETGRLQLSVESVPC